MNKANQACGRCINGQLMALGDEVACINCGWRPTQATPSPYVATSRRAIAA
jgi:hypothetical protein